MNAKERRAAKRAAMKGVGEERTVRDHVIPNFTPPGWVPREMEDEETGEIWVEEMEKGWYYIGDAILMPNGEAVAHGKGVVYTPKRKVFFRGEFVDGLQHGIGKLEGGKQAIWEHGRWARPLPF